MSKWQPTAAPLRGIIVPMVTPLAAADELDVAGLERLVSRLLAGGVHGLFLLGTCGEGPSLSSRLQRELVDLDPPTAARLGAGDRQRILRALEVALSTGRPLSSWIAQRPFGERRLAATRVGLTLSRRVLYDRIAVRVCRMKDDGLEEEVRRLLESGVPPEAPAFQAIGYRQFAQAVLGLWTSDRAVAETILATRRFAKRQQTWFRAERDIVWFDAAVPASVPDEVMTHLRGSDFGRDR